MCGIVGYMTTEDDLHKGARQHLLKYALSMDTIRGADSTGIMTVMNKFDVYAARTTQRGDKFVNTPTYAKVKKDGWCTVGHNRAATAGSVKVGNAHPFKFGDVTMVHNGTLLKAGASIATFDKSLEVDSMQICLGLSKAPVDGVKEFLETIDGSFMLIWFDERDESVNFARNTTRPMHFTMNHTKTFMGFMSDGHMLTAIMKSFGSDPARGHTVYSLDSMMHCKFKKGSLVPEVTKFRPFVRPVVNLPGRWTNSGTGGGTTGKQTHGTSALAKARDKWDNRNSPSGGTKVMINHKLQEIPSAHVDALDMYMELKPSDELAFQPFQDWETGKHTSMMEGRVIMAHWAGAVYPALIMNVPRAECNAYWDREWTVKPIGLTRPIEPDQDTPTLLCKVVNFKWEEEVNPTEVPVSMVQDVQGRFVLPEILEKELARGCVNCDGELPIKDIAKFTSVNNGQDTLCEDCSFNQKAGEL